MPDRAGSELCCLGGSEFETLRTSQLCKQQPATALLIIQHHSNHLLAFWVFIISLIFGGFWCFFPHSLFHFCLPFSDVLSGHVQKKLRIERNIHQDGGMHHVTIQFSAYMSNPTSPYQFCNKIDLGLILLNLVFERYQFLWWYLPLLSRRHNLNHC